MARHKEITMKKYLISVGLYEEMHVITARDEADVRKQFEQLTTYDGTDESHKGTIDSSLEGQEINSISELL